MPTRTRTSALSAVVLTLTACDSSQPEFGDTTTVHAAAKSGVCHYDADTDTYHLINVADASLPAHTAHGDASPSETVPTMPDFAFDNACEPQQVTTELPPC